MIFPRESDFIDIHTHDAQQREGVFSVDVLMAHENRLPEKIPGILFTYGIHPWHLNAGNHDQLMASLMKNAVNPLVIAIGEAGFDRIKGPDMELQRRTFREQAAVSEELGKPLVVHCVRAWDELLAEHKKIKPEKPWLVHGFRGKKELAKQLVSKGMYISFWFDYILKPESADLARSIPQDRIFLETDGADVDIREIYNKVSGDLGISVDQLKVIFFLNFKDFFKFYK